MSGLRDVPPVSLEDVLHELTTETCETCGGEGEITYRDRSNDGSARFFEPKYVVETCETCHGSGEVDA